MRLLSSYIPWLANTTIRATGYPVVNKENSEDEHTLERVSPGDSVIEAVENMTEEGIGRLLVMEDDKLVGIVSRSAIMDGAIKRLWA